MNVYLVKHRKIIEWEGDEFTFYVVAAKNEYAAMRLVDDTYKMGTGNLNASDAVPEVKTFKSVKEPKILLSYDA